MQNSKVLSWGPYFTPQRLLILQELEAESTDQDVAEVPVAETPSGVDAVPHPPVVSCATTASDVTRPANGPRPTTPGSRQQQPASTVKDLAAKTAVVSTSKDQLDEDPI